jgi:hypothetical protein
MTYVPNSSQSDLVLGRLTFTPTNVPSPSFTMSAAVVGRRSVRVFFSNPVDDSALSPGSYSISSLPGPPSYVPTITSASFDDSDRMSVSLTLGSALTYPNQYVLAAEGVFSYYGENSVSGHQFTASVPDPPQAVDAFLAGQGFVDVVFDRPVGPYTTAASGILAAVDLPADSPAGYEQSYLTSVPWDPSIPENNVRFSLSGFPFLYGPPAVSFRGVRDASYNVSNEIVDLTVADPPPLPYYFGSVFSAHVTRAYVDSLSDDPRGPGRALVNVFFNRPMLGPDVLDTSKWLVKQQGFHPVGDFVSLPSPFPVLFDLLTFCTAFQSSFNAHVASQLLHPKYVAAPDETAVIALAADLKSRFNAHAGSPAFHLVADPADEVLSPGPSTLEEAIVVLNDLKLKFDTHRTALGVHVSPDVDFPVVLSDAVDAVTASVLADELRSKVLNHEVSTDYHVVADLSNNPSAPYSGKLLLPLGTVTLKDAMRFVEEAQSKFVAHGLDKFTHLYPDTAHTSAVVPSYHTTILDAQNACLVLRAQYPGHLPLFFPIPYPFIVRNRASAASSFPPVDSLTYFAQLEIGADSSVPSYQVSASVRTEDLSSVTSFFDVIVASPGFAPPVLITAQTAPDHLFARFDKGLDYPDLTKLSVTDPSGSRIPVSSVSLVPSLRSLFLLTTDLMEAYRWHNQPPNGAGHKVQDTVNYLLDSEFPSESLPSVIAALNRLRDVYDEHSVSTSFHVGPDPNPVLTPYASDFGSAVSLASTMSEIFGVHNVNTGIHLSAGAIYASHSLYDTVDVGAEGFKEGERYVLRMENKGFFRDVRNGNVRRVSESRLSFHGKSYSPYLASAVPKSGVAHTPSGMRLLPDSVRWFFSKPMIQSNPGPGDLSFSPSVNVGRSSWSGPDALSTVINNMSPSPYSADAAGMHDKFGNRVGRFIPPEFLIPIIPNVFAVGPFSIGPGGYSSIHYGDGRPAAYFSVDSYDDHVAAILAFPSALPIETYLYDQEMNLLASTPASPSFNQVLHNFTRGRYIVEVTVQNALDTPTITVDFPSRSEPPVPTLMEATVGLAVGTGTASDNMPGGYAAHMFFTADSVATYLHVTVETPSWAPSVPGYVFVWVTSGSRTGPGVAFGSGAGLFTMPFTTVISGQYFVEVVSSTPGPLLVSVRPSDFP